MPVELVTDLGRMTMKEVFLLASPILVIAVVVSLTINIIQVLTSLQETTISAVPRLLA
ncbi:MAG: flagellar biosynthetic protein FliQ, partial [Terriglobales bacterium]